MLMGQGSKLAAWPTHGRLRWSKVGEYKEEIPHYEGGSKNLGKKHDSLKNCNCV